MGKFVKRHLALNALFQMTILNLNLETEVISKVNFPLTTQEGKSIF
jgi:hypothetical protein